MPGAEAGNRIRLTARCGGLFLFQIAILVQVAGTYAGKVPATKDGANQNVAIIVKGYVGFQ